MTRFSAFNSLPEATSSSRTPSQTVGTPAENVTPSACAISTRRLAAMSCPTITCLAPVMADINGRPQQFAWNMGTTGITTSRAEIANASTRHPFMACKTVERWEKSLIIKYVVVSSGYFTHHDALDL